jgi:minor extracellular protease Epr
MRKYAILLMSLALVSPQPFAGTVFAESDTEQNVLIVFEDGVSEEEMTEAVEEAGGQMEEEYEEVAVASAKITASAAEELLADPAIAHIEEDIIVKLSAQMEDWGIGSSKIPTAWNAGFTGKGVKISVIDSGISPHEDLRIAGGYSAVDYTTSYSDDQGHGTHVAGIIGARHNSFGVRGVAYDAELYAVKAFDENGQAYLSDMIEGIDWSVANGIDIINLSAGTQTDSFALRSSVDKAYAAGLLVVAAAGNDGNDLGTGDTVDFPARYPSAISVGAVDRNSARALFSSTGSTVEVTAPGVNIASTYPNNQYVYMSGTSMATPYVAGNLALMKQAYPQLTNEQLRQVLVSQVRDAGPAGHDPYFGFGILQASAYTTPIVIKEDLSVSGLTTSKTLLAGEPGNSFQLTASAQLKNGTKEDVTAKAVWSSANPAVATADKGQIVLKSTGTTTVTVTYEGFSAQISISSQYPPEPVPAPVPVEEPDPHRFQDVTSFYAPAVEYMLSRNITQGMTETEFGISKPIIRADAAIWLAKELGLNTAAAPASGFSDVPTRAAGAVNALKAAGIIGGKAADRFGSYDSLTRGEIAIILQRAYELEAGNTTSDFTDVSDRYASAVNSLVANNITNGISPTRFGVSQNVTRGQLAVFIYRLAVQ